MSTDLASIDNHVEDLRHRIEPGHIALVESETVPELLGRSAGDTTVEAERATEVVRLLQKPVVDPDLVDLTARKRKIR